MVFAVELRGAGLSLVFAVELREAGLSLVFAVELRGAGLSLVFTVGSVGLTFVFAAEPGDNPVWTEVCLARATSCLPAFDGNDVFFGESCVTEDLESALALTFASCTGSPSFSSRTRPLFASRESEVGSFGEGPVLLSRIVAMRALAAGL